MSNTPLISTSGNSTDREIFVSATRDQSTEPMLAKWSFQVSVIHDLRTRKHRSRVSLRLHAEIVGVVKHVDEESKGRFDAGGCKYFFRCCSFSHWR